jgi:predicted regulator of amino acid metabolism with ACT domain
MEARRPEALATLEAEIRLRHGSITTDGSAEIGLSNDDSNTHKETMDAILADEDLSRIFQNISAIPSLMDLAPVLDLSVLTVAVRDAEESGIVATITDAIAEQGISIRQVISEDPEFTDEAKLYVITDEALPGDLLNDLRDLPFVTRIELQ